MEDSEQIEKQNFLRKNILEKGYDVNQFVSFLKSKKGEAGSDISNWSMPDLYDVVKEFISQNLPNQQTDSQPQQTQPLTQSQLNNSPAVATIQTAGLNQNITLTEEDFGIVIPEYLECLKSETNELSKYEDIEITVKEPKKVDNGFFSKTYVNFLITTNPININVRRKHDDLIEIELVAEFVEVGNLFVDWGDFEK